MTNHKKKEQHVVAFFITSYVLFLLGVMIYFGSKQASLLAAEREYNSRQYLNTANSMYEVNSNVLGSQDEESLIMPDENQMEPEVVVDETMEPETYVPEETSEFEQYPDTPIYDETMPVEPDPIF